MLYDGQEVTYTPHMLKLCCVWYTYGKPLKVNHTEHTFKYNVVLEVHVLDVVLEV